MTGPEHYKAAERCLELADERPDGDRYLAAALVHAKLADAAATAMAARLNDTLSGFAVGMDTPDQKAWDKVAGEGR